MDTGEQCPIVQLFGNHSEATEMLRCLRDEVLNKTPEGQEIIKLYYQWSPALVRAMAGDESFKKEVKEMFDWFVPMLGETVQ